MEEYNDDHVKIINRSSIKKPLTEEEAELIDRRCAQYRWRIVDGQLRLVRY